MKPSAGYSDMNKRRLGLTANAAPLLSVVGNCPRRAAKAKAKTPIAHDDPPMSTDTEHDSTSEGTVEASETSCRSKNLKRKAVRASSSSSKGDCESDASVRRRTQQATIKTTKFTSTTSKAQKEDDAPRKRIKCSDPPKTVLTPGNHLRTKFGFTSIKKNKSTYGKRSNASQSSQPGSSQGNNSKLRIPSSIETPKKKKAKLIMPGSDISVSPKGSSRKLITSFNSDSDSIWEDSIMKQAKTKKNDKNTSKPSKPRAMLKIPIDYLSSQPDEKPSTGSGSVSDLSVADSQNKVPQLIVPDDFEESLLSSPPSSPPPPSAPAPPPAAECPWCYEKVDRELLDNFSQGKRLHVRLQTRFCQLHKQITAKKTWTDLGYPDICWEGIEDRFAAHRDHLTAVIVDDDCGSGGGHHPSKFRRRLARDVDEGRARGMKREMNEDMSPGYYGPRGFNLMCDWLVAEFASVLKRQADHDRVVAGRGSGTFIQAVLVPELAVRLIMDDMGLSEAKAMQLLEESKPLGELVHQEVET